MDITENKNNHDETLQENLSDARRFVMQTQKNIASLRGVYRFAIVIAAVIALGSVAFSFWKSSTEREMVYVINNESARKANIADNTVQRDLEIVDHIARFHEKFYNLSPNPATIDENIDMAIALADESAILMDNRRREQRFYTNLVDNMMVEEIYIDSTNVNTAVYPYQAYTYGRLYIIRQSRVTKYNYESSCQLTNVARTTQNPHGLMIEHFREEKVSLSDSQDR